MKPEHAMDEALSILAGSGPEFGGGLSNHGPMAAEALCALGHSDRVAQWAHRYRTRLEPYPAVSGRISGAAWRGSLGDYRMVGAWREFFADQLKQAPWREILNRWVAHLAPGISAAAFHGVIRTAHAVRTLDCEENTLRLDELAEGLSYWAATYSLLPHAQDTAQRALPSSAIALVPLMPGNPHDRIGLLTGGVADAAQQPQFGAVLSMADVSSVDAFLSDLTATFARAYLANADSIFFSIAFLHSVTGPAAIRLMLPHLDESVARDAARFAWQASAALYSAFAKSPLTNIRVDASESPSQADLAGRAIDSADEHAIKFTEACLREHRINPRPEYLAAAAHAVSILPPLS